jgi:hypothetical protein
VRSVLSEKKLCRLFCFTETPETVENYPARYRTYTYALENGSEITLFTQQNVSVLNTFRLLTTKSGSVRRANRVKTLAAAPHPSEKHVKAKHNVGGGSNFTRITI